MSWGAVFGAVLIIVATLVVSTVIVQLFRMLIDYHVARRSQELTRKLIEADASCKLAELRYSQALATAAEYRRKYMELLNSTNITIDRLHRLLRANPAPQFNADEIARLVRLCHPDRHNNSEASVKMTQKLMSLRN